MCALKIIIIVLFLYSLVKKAPTTIFRLRNFIIRPNHIPFYSSGLLENLYVQKIAQSQVYIYGLVAFTQTSPSTVFQKVRPFTWFSICIHMK